ncbi:chemotaxis protein CheC [Paenibacillus senegalensis]|uniref:chemotaxis protein CheC n=1 Tax=Paenibacillus senegalensis TaxID=1465766 RepID=UPI00028A181E|nr:chemotaxis protein CheC [Paenibacillus senegalensis]
MSFINRLADFQMDVLKEVGNIGAGHAATALSTLLNKPVDMSVPAVKIVSFEEISASVGGPEQPVVAVFLRVDGECSGSLFLLFAETSARVLMNLLLNKEEGGEGEFTEMELSVLLEIGNILAGSYLSSLSELTGIQLSPSVPSLAIDMAGAILSFGVLSYGEMGDQALFIDTVFLEGGHQLEGSFFFIPDPHTFSHLFQALGVPGL